jgi:serine/threonine protein kinase
MDKADGTLLEIMQKNQIPNVQLLIWIKQNIQFLATVQKDIHLTHRDIKPDNIFIRAN